MEHPVHPSLIDQINRALQSPFADAQLIASLLPDLPLKLWLIDLAPCSVLAQKKTQRRLITAVLVFLLGQWFSFSAMDFAASWSR